MFKQLFVSPLLVAVVVFAAGCGGSSKAPSTAGASQGGSAAEAKATASGDIPDNQVFLTLTSRPAGWSMRYPEGWTQRGGGADVSLVDKSNVVHVVIAPGPMPSTAGVAAQLKSLQARDPSLQSQPPRSVRLKSGSAIKVSYQRQGPADPVTGKRTTLVVDRYELAKGGKVATVELGSPKGVDNVDAYRMMIESFRWL
jgi:hypothetical protein